MKRFDCLDRHLDIRSHALLEASAGTGKTFSIENLFVRLLLEEPVCTIEEILVVTFTRAATKELKARIREKIAHTLKAIKERNSNKAPDYLLAILEKEEREIKLAKRRLESALSAFDLSKIWTIHSFSERTLRENQFVLDSDSKAMNELLESTEILKVIRDFFRTELTKEAYSSAQILRVLSRFKQDFTKLEMALLRALSKGLPIEKSGNYSELFSKFQTAVKVLSGKYSSQEVLKDFDLQVPFYNKMTGENRAKVESFCQIFDKTKVDESDFDMLIKDGLLYLDLLDPSNAKKKKKSELMASLYLAEIKEKLSPLVVEARSPEVIFSRMAHDCQNLLNEYLGNQEKYRYDDLLTLMLKRSMGPEFKEKVRNLYRAAIIDEFQDTDPIQWKIFQTLFLHDPKKRSVLYLVGDPKQSIYAFREADIYTYMSAAKELGDGHMGTLNVNYRSHPSLIKALNALFSNDNVPGMISLPKENMSLKYRQVESSPNSAEMAFNDEKGSVHFLIAKGNKRGPSWPSSSLQEEMYFPAITNEIIRLKECARIGYSEWAILARDRYQAKNFSAFCKNCGIPTRTQRQRSLFESEALTSMKELLTAILEPKNLSALKVVLASPLIGWDHRKIKELNDEEKLSAVSEEMAKLYQKDFAALYDQFINSRFLRDFTIKERLLSESLEFFYDFEQIAELLIDFQYQNNSSLMRCYEHLLDFETMQVNDDDRIKCRQNLEGDAVQILTMHTSKGLEFGVVVALGLMNRTPQKDELITAHRKQERVLVPALSGEELFKQKEEIDAEKMRQLYVAMTRAKYRVYVPIAIQENLSKPIAQGEASPIELYLKAFQRDSFTDWIDQTGKLNHISYEYLSSPIQTKSAPQEKKETKVIKPKKLSFSFKREVIRSFSSLAKPHRTLDSQAPHDFCSEMKNFHTLPSGKEIGTILHKILENISIEKVKHSKNTDDLLPYVNACTQGTPFEEWNSVITEMIEKILKTPLKIGPNTLALCDICPEKFYREIEFLYPSQTNSDMFLKGVIDFVFEHGGLYYLLDWKSNWLGNSDDDYHFANLEQSMKDHDYFLQAKIYQEALKRYLALFDDRPFEACFGGSVYLFLRGIGNSETNGVYFTPC